MSIKRSRQRSYGSRDRGDDGSTFSFDKREAEPEKSWEEQVQGQADEAFQPYSLQTTYSKGSLIAHSKFGKGVVVAVEEGRVDVLFADGRRKLGHKPR